MSRDDALQDVATRQRQLEAHMLSSAPYLQRAHLELKRRITYLCLAICALVITLAGFFLHPAPQFSNASLILFSVTSLLAIINVALFLQTKAWMKQVNEAWLPPEEREVLATLRSQHDRILQGESVSKSQG